VEFGVNIPQGIDVQSARAVLRELLGGIGKLRRYSGSRKLAEKGDHENYGIGPQSLDLGCWICSKEDRSLTTVRSAEGA
jgi:hypothetical protein